MKWYYGVEFKKKLYGFLIDFFKLLSDIYNEAIDLLKSPKPQDPNGTASTLLFLRLTSQQCVQGLAEKLVDILKIQVQNFFII